MDITSLVKSVLSNERITNRVFYFVHVLSVQQVSTSKPQHKYNNDLIKRYHQINDVGWMLNQEYISLLIDKIKNTKEEDDQHPRLICGHNDAIRALIDIGNIADFKLFYQRFQHLYFQPQVIKNTLEKASSLSSNPDSYFEKVDILKQQSTPTTIDNLDCNLYINGMSMDTIVNKIIIPKYNLTGPNPKVTPEMIVDTITGDPYSIPHMKHNLKAFDYNVWVNYLDRANLSTGYYIMRYLVGDESIEMVKEQLFTEQEYN